MKIEFLKNNPEFINQIATLMFREWGHLRTGSTIETYIDRIGNRVNDTKIPLTIIAKSEAQELIGFASLVQFDMDINRDLFPWISGVFVCNQYRRQGIGASIVNKIEQIAAKLGYSHLYLFTFDRQSFYFNLSWEKVKDDFYLNKPVTVMTKRIV